MNLFDVISIESAIDHIAMSQDGELTPEQWDVLVNAQLSGIEQTKNLVSYVRHLEQFIEDAKEEKARINDIQKKAENRIENIKKYILPYIEMHGSIESGTFKLSIRKSSSVELEEDFVYNLTGKELVEYCIKEVIYYPDKNKIKDALEKNIKIKGAKLTPHDNLQIK